MKFVKEKLTGLMVERGVRQLDLANGIGVKPPVVCLWCSGKAQPSAPLLLKTAEFLEVCPRYFYV
jgi:transcriptional regulator with XRE-family HTH domain